MMSKNSENVIILNNSERMLTSQQFQDLSDVLPEAEWFANIENVNTRRAYKIDVHDFMSYVGIDKLEDFRIVKRPHVIAWRKQLESKGLEAPSIRRKLSALSSLFNSLCEANAVLHNPTHGVKRPTAGANEGKSPSLSDGQARLLLNSPSSETLKGIRDRAIISTLLFHGLRRNEVCSLRVGDIQERRGIFHFRIFGKGGKIRFIPINPHSIQLIREYLSKSSHGDDFDKPLFQRIKKSVGNERKQSLNGNAIYKDVVLKHAKSAGIDPRTICVHGLRATAATNALENNADIAKVQEWLGHSNIATTRLYDRRGTRPENSPTYKVNY